MVGLDLSLCHTDFNAGREWLQALASAAPCTKNTAGTFSQFGRSLNESPTASCEGELMPIELLPEVSLGEVVTVTGLAFAFVQLRIARRNSREAMRATKARFIQDLNQWFNEDEGEKAFFYRLDYSRRKNAFKFDAAAFPHSEEERYLDTLLYKLSHAGALLRSGVVAVNDLTWIRFIAAATLRNEEVQKYLEWLRSPSEVPDHSSFADAIALYEQLFGPNDATLPKLRRYLGATSVA